MSNIREQAALSLRAAGINEPLLDIRELTGGYSKASFDVNDRYILRVATRTGDEVTREQNALIALHSIAGIPRLIGSGSFASDGSLPYLLLSKLPGENAFRSWLSASPETQGNAVNDLVGIMRQVHAIPRRSYSFGYHQTAIDDPSSHYKSWLSGHDAYIQKVFGDVRTFKLNPELASLVEEAEAYYEQHREALSYAIGPRFLHGDLQLYNVILDNNHVTGIIDWEWAHGGEPDFDLADLIRWALFPAHPAEAALEARVRRDDFLPLIKNLLIAYPEVGHTPRLLERLTIYEIEYDLHQMIMGATHWPKSSTVMRQPQERLNGWLHEHLLEDQVAG